MCKDADGCPEKCKDCTCGEMAPNVKEEIETLKLMARNWKHGYKSWIQLGEDNEYVYEDFTEDIITHMHPYMQRFVECEHLTSAEAGDLLEYCHGQVQKLREETEEAERRPNGKISQICERFRNLFTSGKR